MMNRRKWICIGLALTMCTGCSLQTEKDPNFPVTVKDFVYEEAPQMVFTLTGGAAEMVKDLGFESLIYGTAGSGDEAEDSIGNVYKINVEAIRNTVIPVQYENKKGETVEGDPITGPKLLVTTVQLPEYSLLELQQAGVLVLTLPRASTTEELLENYRNLALALGGTERGNEAYQKVESQMESLLNQTKALISGLGKSPDVTLLAQYPFRLATGDTFEGRLLTSVGFSCSGEAYTSWDYPEAEVKVLEPDLVFCYRDEDVETVKKSKEYKTVAAVKNGKVKWIDGSTMENQSLSTYQTLLEMAQFACE